LAQAAWLIGPCSCVPTTAARPAFWRMNRGSGVCTDSAADEVKYTQVVVEPVHAFGSLCGTQLRDAVLFGDEAGQYLVHPVGRHIAFRRIDTNDTNLVRESQRVEAVTACTVSRNRGLLAVCERCSSKPLTQVSVYDLTAVGTRPTQTLEELGGAVGRIVCAAFSAEDSAGLLCLASTCPELLLVVLDWRRNRVLGRFNLSCVANRVAISPSDADIVSVSGEHYVRLYHITDADLELEELPQFSGLGDMPVTIVDHAWAQPADSTLIVPTAEGPVHILCSKIMAVLFTIDVPFMTSSCATPFSVRCFPHGFALGGSAGTVSVWLQDGGGGGDSSAGAGLGGGSPAKKFRHLRSARVRQSDSAICCLDVADNSDGDERQMMLAFGFQDADIGYISISALTMTREELALCTVVSGGFHSGPIACIDLALQRPLIATACRQECAVRIWNYATKRCEICCEFGGNEPTSVAIHPFGYFLAVSLTDKLRFFQILVNELKVHREVSIRGIRLVKFSHGGHLLAVAQGKLVLIFSIRTLAKIATLRGHSQHVTSLCFDPEDRLLLTCSEDGALFEWATQTWTKTHEHFARCSEFLAISAGHGGYSCCSVVEGTRSCLHAFAHCTALEKEEVELPDGLRLGALLCHSSPASDIGTEIPARCLLAGTSLGTLWVCNSSLSVPQVEEQGLHCGGCGALCLSADARTLVTAGDDGVIFVLSVTGLQVSDDGSRRAGGDAGARGAADVVMINRGEIQVRQEELQLLNAENAALQAQLAEQAAKLEGECRARVSEARQQDQSEIQKLRLQYESLQQAATAKERESLRIMKTIEAQHVQAADQLEARYDKKITQEGDRFVLLEADLERLKARIAVIEEDSQIQLEQEGLKQKAELERQVAEKDTEIQKLKNLLAFSQHRFDTMLDQEGMEYDLEVSDLKKCSQEELEQQRLIEYKLKKEQDTLLRGLDMMERDRERIMKEQQEMTSTIGALKGQTEDLARVVSGMKSERREREAALRDKELQIGAQKTKVNTLKKFKHVLDFRLREVTLSLQPKDQMISQLNEQLVELEAEFGRQLEMQHTMEQALQNKCEQVEVLTAEGDHLREVIRQRGRAVQCFTADLHELVTKEQDLREWPEGIKDIYHKHMNPESIAKDEEVRVPIEELRRQTKAIGKKVALMTNNKAAAEVKCRMDIQQKTQENSLLIHELDELRVDRRALQHQVKVLELRVRLAQQKSAQQKALPVEDAPQEGRKEAVPALAMLRTPSGSRLAELELAPRSMLGGGSKGKRMSKSLPAAGRRNKTDSHISAEQRQMMQQLLVTADLNNQQIQMQALENKILRDQVEKLLQEKRATTGSGAPGAAAARTATAGSAAAGLPVAAELPAGLAAGAALAAVRQSAVAAADGPVAKLSAPQSPTSLPPNPASPLSGWVSSGLGS